MLTNLINHRRKVQELIAEAESMDITYYKLSGYLNEVELNIKQANCKHDIEAERCQTHGGEVIIWICKHCKKTIDVETIK